MNADQICRFLEGGSDAGSPPTFERRDVAAAALMVACAQVDGVFDDEERRAICRLVRDQLQLDEETADFLLAVAEHRSGEVWDDWLFIQAIRRGFDEHEQLGVIRRLWEVARSDGAIHPFEEQMIHRIGRQLGIPTEAVEAARRPEDERGGGDAGGRA